MSVCWSLIRDSGGGGWKDAPFCKQELERNRSNLLIELMSMTVHLTFKISEMKYKIKSNLGSLRLRISKCHGLRLQFSHRCFEIDTTWQKYHNREVPLVSFQHSVSLLMTAFCFNTSYVLRLWENGLFRKSYQLRNRSVLQKLILCIDAIDAVWKQPCADEGPLLAADLYPWADTVIKKWTVHTSFLELNRTRAQGDYPAAAGGYRGTQKLTSASERDILNENLAVVRVHLARCNQELRLITQSNLLNLI